MFAFCLMTHFVCAAAHVTRTAGLEGHIKRRRVRRRDSRCCN